MSTQSVDKVRGICRGFFDVNRSKNLIKTDILAAFGIIKILKQRWANPYDDTKCG
jgi:hypothetical protein